jgi:hypothetical protein
VDICEYFRKRDLRARHSLVYIEINIELPTHPLGEREGLRAKKLWAFSIVRRILAEGSIAK